MAAEIYRSYTGASDRNKDPILGVLKEFIKADSSDKQLQCLEISSGSGFHTSYFSKHFPFVTFQPTEFDREDMQRISSFTSECPNVLPPKFLDASQDYLSWVDGTAKAESYDYVININMMHISDYAATLGLFRGCGNVLKPGGFLFTYGPYADRGLITPDSNVQFDTRLKTTNPSWGLRDITLQLIPLAETNRLTLIRREDLPANNKCLVWKKSDLNC